MSVMKLGRVMIVEEIEREETRKMRWPVSILVDATHMTHVSIEV
jgi:hypothetical protein